MLVVAKRSAKANALRWGAGLSGGSAVGGGAAYAGSRDQERKQRRREAGAAAAGGLAGQGLYQAPAYATTNRLKRVMSEPATVVINGKTVPLTRNRRDKILRPVKREHGYASASYFRNYPKELPEARASRVLGWTHRGHTGRALGAGATLAGSGAAYGLSRRRREQVGKNAQYGYRERKVSPRRAAEFGAGAALGTWGATRLKMLPPLVAHGARQAGRYGGTERAEEALRLATATGRVLRTQTGRGEAQLRRIKRVNDAIEAVPTQLRPAVATTAGALLVGHALPVRQERFTPVQTVRGRPVHGW